MFSYPGSSAPQDLLLGPEARGARERGDRGEQEDRQGPGGHSADGVAAGGAEGD